MVQAVQAAEHVEQCRRHGEDGGEIGRAQALQALAARVAPSVHMNPVLLKPQSEIGAQVIVQGKVFGSATAREMQDLKPKLLPYVLESFARHEARSRHRPGRRRRQRVGDQSAQERHRQYGLCPRRRRAGGGDRRHRPRRGDRKPGRHQGGARSRGCEARRRLHRQPHARRHLAVRRRHGGDRAAHRLAGARARAFLRGRAPAAGGRRLRSHRTAALTAATARSEWRCRSCRISPISTISIHSPRSQTSNWSWSSAARHCRSAISSLCRAQNRPSPTSRRFAKLAGTSILPRMCGAADMCLGFAAAIRCWGSHRRSAWHRGRGRIGAGLGPVAGRHGHRRREGARRSQRHDCCRCGARQRL